MKLATLTWLQEKKETGWQVERSGEGPSHCTVFLVRSVDF